jgi:periplasmic protein CpxP/Spy
MNRTCTTALLLTAALALAGLTARAEDQPAPANPPPTPQHREGRRAEFLERIEQKLDLTDAQKAQIKPILQDARKQVQALRQDTTLTREQKHEKIEAIHQQVTDKLKGILTPEQMEKLHKLREEARERFQQRRAEKQ